VLRLKPLIVDPVAAHPLRIQHRVDPLQRGNILGLSPCQDSAFMSAVSLGHGAEARQAIRINGAASSKAFVGPICNRFVLEAGYQTELDAQRVAFISEGDSGDR